MLSLFVNLSDILQWLTFRVLRYVTYFKGVNNFKGITKSNNQLLALVSFVFRDKILKQIHTLKC